MKYRAIIFDNLMEREIVTLAVNTEETAIEIGLSKIERLKVFYNCDNSRFTIDYVERF